MTPILALYQACLYSPPDLFRRSDLPLDPIALGIPSGQRLVQPLGIVPDWGLKLVAGKVERGDRQTAQRGNRKSPDGFGVGSDVPQDKRGLAGQVERRARRAGLGRDRAIRLHVRHGIPLPIATPVALPASTATQGGLRAQQSV